MQLALKPDLVINERYRLERKLGGGGFGEVWQARQLSIERSVAIKVLKVSDESARLRFGAEARALRTLQNEHCVQIFDSGTLSDGRAYIVTEYVAGETLDRWLDGKPPAAQLLEVARQIARALEHAHSLDVSHRDIKPPNIVVREDGGSVFATVLDFGLAKLVGTKLTDVTKTGEVVGTPGFMSPEQLRARRDIGPPSDVYSFGVLLFQMFEGRPPFAGETRLELSMKHVHDPAPALTSTVSPAIAQLIGGMMQKNPVRRPSMRVVREVLETGRPPARASVQRRAIPDSTETSTWLLGLGLVLAFGLLIFAFWEPSVPQKPARTRLIQPASTQTPQPEREEEPELAAARSGCGIASPTGIRMLADVRRIEERKALVRVPSTYDPNTPAPVLMVFHDVPQTPIQMLQIDEMNAYADARGFVLVAPDDREITHVWLEAGDYDRALDSLDLAGTQLCLDLDRVFLFGHGNGGLAADQIACRIGPAALATTAHRFWGRHGLCAEQANVPRLFFSALADGVSPAEGGVGCAFGEAKWSIARHEDALSKHHSCGGPIRTTYDSKVGSCTTQDCEPDLELCSVEGGRYWRTMPLSKNHALEFCIGPAADLPFADRIWEFFAAHDPGAKPSPPPAGGEPD